MDDLGVAFSHAPLGTVIGVAGGGRLPGCHLCMAAGSPRAAAAPGPRRPALARAPARPAAGRAGARP